MVIQKIFPSIMAMLRGVQDRLLADVFLIGRFEKNHWICTFFPTCSQHFNISAMKIFIGITFRRSFFFLVAYLLNHWLLNKFATRFYHVKKPKVCDLSCNKSSERNFPCFLTKLKPGWKRLWPHLYCFTYFKFNSFSGFWSVVIYIR